MKKTYLKLIVFLIFLNNTVYSQKKTLFLEIDALKSLDIKLHYEEKLIRPEDSLLTADTFSLKIASIKDAKVIIATAEGDSRSVALTDFTKPFIVRNDTLKDPSFILPKNVSLLVTNKNGDTIKKYTLTYIRAGKYKAAITSPAESNYKVGSAINDALYLANHSDATAFKILSFYDNNESNAAKLKKDLDSNNFLKEILDGITSLKDQQSGGILGTIVNAAGNTDVTNIADGLAKFIVKRVKAELSMAFFKKFKEELQKYPDLKTVFPHTEMILRSIDQDIYDYSKYIYNLRDAFRSDLQIIDQNLPGIIDNHPDFFKQKTNFELGVALRSGCYVAGSLKNDMHPGDILDAYPINFFDNPPAEDQETLLAIKGSIQFLQLLSESLKENDSTKQNYWVGIEKIRQLVNDQKALKIYLGLTLQIAHIKYKNIPYSSSANCYDVLNKAGDNPAFTTDYTLYKNYILNLGNKLNELNTMIKSYEKPASDSAKIEQYAKYFSVSNQLIGNCVEIGTLPHFRDIVILKNISEHSKKYFGIATEVADLVTAINRRKYADIVNHAVAIYSDVVAEPAHGGSTSSLTKTQKIALGEEVLKQNTIDPKTPVASTNSNTPAIEKITQNNNTDIPDAGKVLGLLAKYGALMSNLIDAKTSDDVANVIENAALPTGSARIKRQSISNVSVNAYCGLFIGHEKITGVTDNQFFNAYGVAAPIGVSASLGSKGGWSHSAFISLIDLGAVAAFRFTDNTTEQVPTIQLKDIFSPGLFYSLGIAKTPLSVNIGAQVGPNLRKVTKDSNDYSGKTYIRYSLSVCVDLPLLNLYTKSR